MNRQHTIFGLAVALVAMAKAATVPSELKSTLFSGPDLTPCPAVICAAPTGEVFVGVDMQGSLGKGEGYGKIIRLVDKDGDGKVDESTEFAKINNPRGLISLGNDLIVLHCTVKDGKPHNQAISVFTDADADGVADGPPKALVTGIGNPKFIQSRGADHCTNNIRLGIDGWVYISVGDFGFIDAEGTDGTKLSMLGGGVVRVRPDGSEMETFIHGTRNVYDVSIDPFMNVFTRENTNDGVGWWIRFSHYIQTGEFGYPSLYTNFPEDMLPALGEYGGGSGTGCLYLEEPQWPEKYNKNNLLADWGRSKVFIHRVTPDGASFTNQPEEFFGSAQVADLDVDASGRMYVAAWAGAGYRGNPKKGFVDLIVPKDWKYVPFPKLSGQSEDNLVSLLKSESHTVRTYASQELVARKASAKSAALVSLAKDKKNSLASRVAAIYTLAQIEGKNGLDKLQDLSSDKDLREHAIRCMADRLELAQQADIKILAAALKDENPRVQVAAAVAIGRTGNQSAASHLVPFAKHPEVKSASSEPVSGVKSRQISKLNRYHKFDVDISSYERLFLVVDPEGSNGNDQVAWFNPVIVTKDGKKIPLVGEKWVSAKAGWGKVQVNADCTGKALPDGAKGIGTHSPSVIEFKVPANAAKFICKAGMTPGSKGKGTVTFQVSPVPVQPKESTKPHSTPNKDIILPHVARQALLALDAQEAVIAGLQSPDKNTQGGALDAMKFMHSMKVVDALIEKAKSADSELKQKIAMVLIRLHQQEAEYDGSTWWGTRPNPHGPYYYPVDWDASEKIAVFVKGYIESLPAEKQAVVIAEVKRCKAYIDPYNPRSSKGGKVVKTIGKTAIEDVVLQMDKLKGKAANGAKVITKVGCAACHNIDTKGVIKGPDLTSLGNTKKADLVEAIIKPAASIAASWVTINMKDGASHVGTLITENNKEIILHNIAGIPTKLKASEVKSRGPGMNMMSEHLCDSLSLQEFADLLEYIQSMDPKRKKGKK